MNLININSAWVQNPVIVLIVYGILISFIIYRYPDHIKHYARKWYLVWFLWPLIFFAEVRSLRRILVNIVGVLLVVWFTQFLGDWIQPALTPADIFPPPFSGPKAVELQMVDQGQVVSLATYTGTALPYESVNINARVDGTIQKLNVYEGEYVKAGTVLAKLDTSHLKPLYDKALAESRFWQAEWGRAKELYEDKVISALERDRVRKSYETSAAHAQQMWAQLNYATVKTPVGGWIAKRKAFQGQYIRKGEMMFRVDRLDALRIQFHVSERDLPFIRNGDPVWLEFPQMSMLAFNRNGWRDKIMPSTEEQIATSLVGKEPFVNVADRVLPNTDKQANPGLIAEVAVIFPSVDPKTHTGIVEARIGNPGTLLKSDSYVVGHFRVEHVNDVVRVPSKAVLQMPDKRDVVFVGPAFSDEGNAELREVQIGLKANGRTEIISGVEANEFVIVRGQRNLSDGEFVTVVKRNGGF